MYVLKITCLSTIDKLVVYIAYYFLTRSIVVRTAGSSTWGMESCVTGGRITFSPGRSERQSGKGLLKMWQQPGLCRPMLRNTTAEKKYLEWTEIKKCDRWLVKMCYLKWIFTICTVINVFIYLSVFCLVSLFVNLSWELTLWSKRASLIETDEKFYLSVLFYFHLFIYLKSSSPIRKSDWLEVMVKCMSTFF